MWVTLVDGALPGGDRLDVTASLGGEIHHHAARLHVGHHVLLDEDGRLLDGDEGGDDDDVQLLALVMEQLHSSQP